MKGGIFTRYQAPPKAVEAEVTTIYVDPGDRFIVSLVVGYDAQTITDEVGAEASVEDKARAAAAAALDLTRDLGSTDTIWFVYDRQTKRTFEFEQHEFEKEEDR